MTASFTATTTNTFCVIYITGLCLLLACWYVKIFLKNPISKCFLCSHLIEKSSVGFTLPQGKKNGSVVVMRQTMVPGYAVLSLLWGRGTEIKYLVFTFANSI